MVKRRAKGISRRGARGVLAVGLSLAGMLGAVTQQAAPASAAAAAVIVSRGLASSASYGMGSTQMLTLALPNGATVGDVVVASIGIASGTTGLQPSIAAPAGWTLSTRTPSAGGGSIAVYWHVVGAGESSFAWTTSVAVGGVAFMTAFGGVDSLSPIDTAGGNSNNNKTTSIATPSLTTASAGELLISSFFGYTSKQRNSNWNVPSAMTELGDRNDRSNVSGSVDFAIQAAAGSTGLKSSTASVSQNYAIAVLSALRPAQSVDTTAPVVSGVGVGSVTTSGALVTWTTDEASDSQVEYGPSTTYGTTAPPNPTAVVSHSIALSGLSAATTYHYRVRSRDAAGNVGLSNDATFQTPATPPNGPVPLIVDTDIFSNTDDVGALAIAFALQLRGEAQVLAIGVSTRTSRPTVATNSWKCAAAIAQFYGAGATPIGTDMPNNGIETNTVDFIGPCSRLLSPATPLPDTALRVYRQSLAAQADGTVVISAVGYSENLAALLNSPPDTISPLSGRELIARKVKLLSIMAGGYPSRSVENNLAGNPAAAQDLAVNWPGKISWSGYEVGDAVHTGTTISRTHPISSPVRVSYEAFVGPNNWIYSYDLTAVYHAVRPNDSLLTEVGPGINTVTSTGGNYFTAGPGNQFYLRLSDATALDAAIEALLDTLPTVLPADTTAPVVSGVGVGSVTVSGALVTWTTDEVSDSQVEYGPSSTYGTTSPLNPTAVVSHSIALSGLSAATTYHFRVRSRDAAGNVGLSNDVTFQTHGTPPLLLNETFDANVIDPTKWLAVTGGSTVVAANQQLEISHPPGPWTTGSLQSVTPHDQTNRVLQLQLKRAANNGLGGTTFGETSVFLWRDPTHYAEFFIAGGSLTALMNGGSGEVNLTPSWPGYSATSNQWVRFRESAGTLYWEYADGTTTPGTWTTMASASNPFAMDSVVVKMIAGANVNVVDTAMLDNVALI